MTKEAGWQKILEQKRNNNLSLKHQGNSVDKNIQNWSQSFLKDEKKIAQILKNSRIIGKISAKTGLTPNQLKQTYTEGNHVNLEQMQKDFRNGKGCDMIKAKHEKQNSEISNKKEEFADKILKAQELQNQALIGI